MTLIPEQLLQMFPELREGADRREQLAAACAAKDAETLGLPEEHVRRRYERLFHEVCTDDLLQKLADGPIEGRWQSAVTLGHAIEDELPPFRAEPFRLRRKRRA